MIIILYGELI